MKVGLMTWFHYHNYGTALQIVALSRKINNYGNDTCVINYLAVLLVSQFRGLKIIFIMSTMKQTESHGLINFMQIIWDLPSLLLH